MNPTSVKDVKHFLNQHKLAPLKKLGQNFLVDANITAKIAQSAGTANADCVFEIGTGLGALTRALCATFGQVVSIELDHGLYACYGELLADLPNATLLQGDALETNLQEVGEKFFKDAAFHVCGNLPYYITSKLLLHILESGAPIASATFMVQKEVAQRLAAAPGDPDYGALTASLCYYARPQILFNVSKNCFYPAPDVDSSIIQFIPASPPHFDVARADYTRIVRAAFAMRRKTIFNNLKALAGADAARAALHQAEIPENARAQDLAPNQYATIARNMKDLQ